LPTDSERAAHGTTTISTRCPACGSEVRGSARQIVNRSDQSAVSALLSGNLNLLRCSACNTAFLAPVPILFHDPEAGEALVFLPGGLTTAHDEQQRQIGALTNRALTTLSETDPRSHLLQPKLFLTQESFMEAVLRATGVSTDEIERARAMTDLVRSLAIELPETNEELEERLSASEHGRDPALADVAQGLAERAQAAGDQTARQRFEEVAGRLAAVLPDRAQLDLDRVIEMLLRAHRGGELRELVQQLRQLLDYSFFTALTARRDQAVADDFADRANELTELRSELVRAIDEVDAAMKVRLDKATALLSEVLELAGAERESKLREALAASESESAEALFMVLAANRDAAEKAGSSSAAEAIDEIERAALSIVEEAFDPSERLVRQLLRARDDAERSARIAEALDDGVLTDELVPHLQRLATMLRSSGTDEAAEAADSLESAAELAGKAGPSSQAATGARVLRP